MNRVVFWVFSYAFMSLGLLMLVLEDPTGRSGPFVVGGILLAAICQAWEDLETKGRP